MPQVKSKAGQKAKKKQNPLQRLLGVFRGFKFSRNIGIDLGTATVLVYVQGKGIVLQEPSVVAIDTNTDKILKVGEEAQQMLGRTPGNISAVRPLRDGVISQYEVTLKMIQYFIRRACGNMFFQPKVMICIPSGITEVEERAVKDAAREAGAGKVYLIEEPTAAAIGAGLNIYEAEGNMVVDIGGGTTDVAVLSLGGVVVSESIKIAGDKFDEAIMRYVRKKYNVLIGERTAEAIKKHIGAVYDHPKAKTVEVKGRCMKTQEPRVVAVSSKEMLGALTEPLTSILDAILLVIEQAGDDMCADITRGGVMLTGGALLKGMDSFLEDVMGLQVRIASNAETAAVEGAALALSKI